MQLVKPVLEQDASDEVKEVYLQLKKALHVYSLPLFFTYIGAFPEYFLYISDQLIQNVKDQKFSLLVEEGEHRFLSLLSENVPDSSEKEHWLEQYSNTPFFFNFKKDLQSIYSTNVKLCLIFIALREAVKGWAVAAKQLPSEKIKQEPVYPTEDLKNSLIFEDFSSTSIAAATSTEGIIPTSKTNIENLKNQLVVSQPHAIEKNILPEYLQICRFDVMERMKEERFLMTRVTIERLLLSYIGLFPHLIFSPINVVLELTSKYENFSELLYLLSEHFPTYAVQRMMFSGYMLK